LHFVHVDTALIGGLLVPARKTVSAKAVLVHHVDVLHVFAIFHKMFLKTTKGGGLKFELGLSIHFAFLLCVCF